MNIIKKWLQRITLWDYLQNNIIVLSYSMVIFFGVVSLGLSFLVFETKWELISYPTQALQGIVFGLIGIYWTTKNKEFASYFLILYLIVNVLFSLALSYHGNMLITIIINTYTLNIPVIFSAFLLVKKYIIHTTILTFIGTIIVTYCLADRIDILPYSTSILSAMLVTSLILYILRGLLDSKTRDLERANTSRDIFMSKISHELKNPIQGLTAITDIMLIQDKPNDIPSIQALNTMLRYTLGLVGQLENAKEILDGSMALKYESIDIVTEIKTILRAFEFRDELELIFEFEPDLVFTMDRTSLRQIIFNLVDNAIKYADDGYVRLFAGIDVHGWFFFSIGNKGDWILEGEVQSLFKLYERGKRAGSATMGQGIGLSLVKENVELHNGEIRFQSIEHFGILVIVRIPPRE